MNGSILIFGGNKEQREQKIIDIINKEEAKTFEKIKNPTYTLRSYKRMKNP